MRQRPCPTVRPGRPSAIARPVVDTAERHHRAPAPSRASRADARQRRSGARKRHDVQSLGIHNAGSRARLARIPSRGDSQGSPGKRGACGNSGRSNAASSLFGQPHYCDGVAVWISDGSMTGLEEFEVGHASPTRSGERGGGGVGVGLRAGRSRTSPLSRRSTRIPAARSQGQILDRMRCRTEADGSAADAGRRSSS